MVGDFRLLADEGFKLFACACWLPGWDGPSTSPDKRGLGSNPLRRFDAAHHRVHVAADRQTC